MANIVLPPDWRLPERMITPETVFVNRRKFLAQIGLAGAGIAGSGLAARAQGVSTRYPAKRNPDFNPSWTLTDEKVSGSYNNFYEFTLEKLIAPELMAKFVTSPWPIEIGGLVDKPMKLDAAELEQMFPLEERVYRFRCVEAWAMIVPWTGFPLSRLIEKLSPKPEAKFIRFETFNRPEQAPGMKRLARYPWPYFEGLRLDEAMHPLTFLTTGIYGKPLPKQHGAPLRLIVPWKYGYKSIKSIVKIDFIEKQPTTFWETLAPDEYPFESNVNPRIPHPRWSQSFERMIGTNDRVRTQLYNGYGSQVARLYERV